MKLFLVHCGYYDSEICNGLYEGHVNYFIAAENFEDAKTKSKLIEEFKNKKMHIDGMQEIQVVNGYKILLEQDSSIPNQTKIVNFKHREMAPKAKE